MLALLRWFFLVVARSIYSLRYRVRTDGIAEAKSRPGPYLMLANHPAYMDPVAAILYLWPAFRMRPLLLETNFQNPLFAFVAYLMRAIKVPDTEKASAEARLRAEESVRAVIESLKAGDSVILWPTGTLSRDGSDHVGGARAAADVLAAVPNVTLVLLRTRGLWGSTFGWARGTKPKLVKFLLRGVWQLLANLVAFMPRRQVVQTLEAFPPGSRPEPTREAINPWLEAWYNRDAPEVPTFVPYHFAFGPRTFEFPPPRLAAGIDAGAIEPGTMAMVNEIVSAKLKRPLTAAENQPETSFANVGLDSLESMEVALQVEQQFGFTGGDAVPTTLGQLWALAGGRLDKGPPKPPPELWFRPPSDVRPLEILGETLPEAFFHRALRHPNDVACADDLSGAMTYERLLIGTLTLAERFRSLSGDNVGLMLPASVGCDVAFFALHLAGKTPILLNWTTGPGNVAHAVKLTGLTRVVTSKLFIDRTHLEVPGAEFVFLETLRGGVGKLELLKRLIAVRYFGAALAKRTLARLPNDPHRPAVVLFTSGSEKAPKAVPLTHANIIADQRGAVPPQELTRADSVLGFLPMFHSFGLTIAGLFPILAGAKVVHHPDPTDAASLARKLVAYKATLVVGTPTFVNFILNRCGPGDLDAVRLFIVGAEKCPDEVFDRVAKLAPNARVLEGYGITECSPCVAVNPVRAIRRGTIGPPLPGVRVCVTDLESGAVLPAGQMGMLHVAGPTVFPGYLGDAPAPFATIDGTEWYITGDLAMLDSDGYIIFQGRLGRFLKAGGEMVSLPALEEPFVRKYPPTDKGPRVAVEGVERPGGKTIVLFATEAIPLAEANALLQKEGFRGVMRLDEVRTVDAIPVLGTGKTDYKLLRNQIEHVPPGG